MLSVFGYENWSWQKGDENSVSFAGELYSEGHGKIWYGSLETYEYPILKDTSSFLELIAIRQIRTWQNEIKKKIYNYALLIVSIMYGMTWMRLDITHTLGVVSRFTSDLSKKHWEAVKWILRYLRILVFWWQKHFVNRLCCCKNVLNGRSTTYHGTAIRCFLKLQDVVALSTIKVGYVVLTKTTKQIVWLQ